MKKDISVSQDILSQFEETRPEWKDEFDRVSYYMDLGNQIREKTGDNSILMKGVARQLYLKRTVDEKGYVCYQTVTGSYITKFV